MEIPETKRFITKGFELGTTLSQQIALWPYLLHTFWEYCFNPYTVQLFFLFQKTNNKAKSEDEKTPTKPTDDW